MTEFVIAIYKPKPDGLETLKAELRRHHGVLVGEGLATERKPLLMSAKDGTVLEIFEWVDHEAASTAHENDKVMAVWNRMAAVCEFSTLNALEESQGPFPHFQPFEL